MQDLRTTPCLSVRLPNSLVLGTLPTTPGKIFSHFYNRCYDSLMSRDGLGFLKEPGNAQLSRWQSEKGEKVTLINSTCFKQVQERLKPNFFLGKFYLLSDRRSIPGLAVISSKHPSLKHTLIHLRRFTYSKIGFRHFKHLNCLGFCQSTVAIKYLTYRIPSKLFSNF